MLIYYKRIFYTVQEVIGMAGGATLMVILPVYPVAGLLFWLPTEEVTAYLRMDTAAQTLYGLLLLTVYFLLSVVLHNRLFQKKILDPATLKVFRSTPTDKLLALGWISLCIGIFAWALFGS